MLRYLTLTFALALAASTALAKKAKTTATDDNFYVASKTNIDFEETLVEGKMKAPSGFYLQGRQAQSLSQMIKLRSNFRSELRNSRSAVKSAVK